MKAFFDEATSLEGDSSTGASLSGFLKERFAKANGLKAQASATSPKNNAKPGFLLPQDYLQAYGKAPNWLEQLHQGQGVRLNCLESEMRGGLERYLPSAHSRIKLSLERVSRSLSELEQRLERLQASYSTQAPADSAFYPASYHQRLEPLLAQKKRLQGQKLYLQRQWTELSRQKSWLLHWFLPAPMVRVGAKPPNRYWALFTQPGGAEKLITLGLRWMVGKIRPQQAKLALLNDQLKQLEALLQSQLQPGTPAAPDELALLSAQAERLLFEASRL